MGSKENQTQACAKSKHLEQMTCRQMKLVCLGSSEIAREDENMFCHHCDDSLAGHRSVGCYFMFRFFVTGKVLCVEPLYNYVLCSAMPFGPLWFSIVTPLYCLSILSYTLLFWNIGPITY